MSIGNDALGSNMGVFEHLPWSDFTYLGSPGEQYPEVPGAHFDAAFETYDHMCGGVTGRGGDMGQRMAQNPDFVKAYAGYAASFNQGPWWVRVPHRFSYFFTLGRNNKADWVRDDFAKYLADGRMCPERTPGYEKFMPQGQDTIPRSLAQSLLSTGVLYYDNEERSVLFSDDVINLDFESERAKRKLADGAGFRNIWPGERTNVYRNEEGDFLAINGDSIIWSPSSGDGIVSMRFAVNGDGVSERIVNALVIRNDDASEYLFLKYVQTAVDYIDGLTGGAIPNEQNPGSIEKILTAFGYSYSGSNDVAEIADLFYKSALNYERVAGAWLKPGQDESQVSDMRRALLHKAAEQYYLAAAAYVASGRFVTATGMLNQLVYNLRKAGIEADIEIEKIEKAISRLTERSYQRNSFRPPSGGSTSGGGITGASSPITGANDGSTPITAARTIEEDVMGDQGVYECTPAFDPWFEAFPFGQFAFEAVGAF